MSLFDAVFAALRDTDAKLSTYIIVDRSQFKKIAERLDKVRDAVNGSPFFGWGRKASRDLTEFMANTAKELKAAHSVNATDQSVLDYEILYNRLKSTIEQCKTDPDVWNHTDMQYVREYFSNLPTPSEVKRKAEE